MNPTTLIPIVSAVSTLGLILFLAWKESKSGARQITSEVVTNYKILDEQQKTQLHDFNSAIEKLKLEMRTMEKKFLEKIAELKGQILEKDRHIKELQNTVLNRNPELEAVLKEIRDFMAQLSKQNDNQTAILEKGIVRNNRIDKATEEEEGNVMRNKEIK